MRCPWRPQSGIASNMFRHLTKKPTPEETIAQLEQRISELTFLARSLRQC